MAELSKDIAAGLAEFLKTLPEAPKGLTPEAKAARAKQEALRAKTFKTKRFAYYKVGPEGAFVGGVRHYVGDVVKIPVNAMPSATWKAVSEKGVAFAEEKAARAAKELEESAGSAAEDDALEQDELDAGKDSVSEVDDVEAAEADDEVDQAAPTPPPAPAKKAKAKPAVAKPKTGKAGKPSRASDQDVA